MFQPYLWEMLERNDYTGLRKYVPASYITKWYIAVCINSHWIAIIVDLPKKMITQYDTLSRSTEAARIVRREFNEIDELVGFKVQSKQPISQSDGHSCGIHVLDIFTQDNLYNTIEGIKLDRLSVLKTMQHHYGHLPYCKEDPVVDYAGGGPVQETSSSSTDECAPSSRDDSTTLRPRSQLPSESIKQKSNESPDDTTL